MSQRSLRFSHISSYTRHVALGTPRLWAVLHWMMSLEQIIEFVRRSRGCGLEVSVIAGHSKDEEAALVTIFLCLLSPRWESLYLNLFVDKDLEAFPVNGFMFPLLERIVVATVTKDKPGYFNYIISRWNTPRLRSFQGHSEMSLPSSESLQWSTITHISVALLQPPFSSLEKRANDFQAVLESCHNLIKLHVHFESYMQRRDNMEVEFNRSVVLPLLSDLEISGGRHEYNTYSRLLFGYVQMPNLERIKISTHVEGTQTLFARLASLKECMNLQYMEVNAKHGDYTLLLQYLPLALEHLVITRCCQIRPFPTNMLQSIRTVTFKHMRLGVSISKKFLWKLAKSIQASGSSSKLECRF